MNLDELFRSTAKSQPDRPAIRDARMGWFNYRQLDEAIDAVAVALKQAGVGRGSTIGVHFANGIDHIVSNYAVWRVGGCVVPVPHELAIPEKGEVFRKIAIDYLIASTGMASLEFVELFRQGHVAPLPHHAVLVPLHAAREHPTGFAAINAAFIRFSSGTTGASKGVVLSHETIRDRIHAANEAFHLGPDDRVIWVLSMSYHFAVSIVAYLSYGAAIVLPLNHWASGILDSIREEAGTFLYASPTHYAMLADASEGMPLPTLRMAVSTASPLNAQIATRFQTRYDLPLTQALGIIEVGLPAVNIDFAATRLEAVGRVLSSYGLRLENSGLASGMGEVLLSGKGILDAYYEPWQTRDEIMPDGWFRTGDIGELDRDGCLFIRGRTKDIINVAGMKVFPLEVEKVLTSHPAVEDACVFAAADARCGEVPHAKVTLRKDVPTPSSAELMDYCRARLAAQKVPRKIEIVAKLDRTASGKIRHLRPDEATARQDRRTGTRGHVATSS